jgi:hypothetical protein
MERGIQRIRGTTMVKELVTRRSGESERVVYSESVELTKPENAMLASKDDLARRLGRQAGTYLMRYIRGGAVLAEGTFRLVQ